MKCSILNILTKAIKKRIKMPREYISKGRFKAMGKYSSFWLHNPCVSFLKKIVRKVCSTAEFLCITALRVEIEN